MGQFHDQESNIINEKDLLQFVWVFCINKYGNYRKMILPVAKLGALLMKSLGKPLASRLKTHAAKHPRFRQFIIDVAQSNHRFQVNLQRRIYGHDTDVIIHPLNAEKAVQAASDLLGEFIIFVVQNASPRASKSCRKLINFAFDMFIGPGRKGMKSTAIVNVRRFEYVATWKVGGTIVILEVQRSSHSEAFKEAKMRAELDALRERDRNTLRELEVLRLRIDELEKASKPARASWMSAPSFSVLRNQSDQGQEIQAQTQRSLLPPSNQSSTTEKAPQN